MVHSFQGCKNFLLFIFSTIALKKELRTEIHKPEYQLSVLLGTAGSKNLFLNLLSFPIPVCLFTLKNSNSARPKKENAMQI